MTHHDNGPRVGIIGLGAMGLGMASNLARSGFSVTGFDIQQSAVEQLVARGAKGADTPSAAAEDADLLIIVVATSDQTSTVLFDDEIGALTTLPQGSTILLCITALPDYVTALDRRLKTVGRPDIKLIDCPISGGEARAWNGTLSLLCAGHEPDISSIRDVLDCLSSRLHIVSSRIGDGSSLKLVHQILVGVHILASVELMGLCYVAGLDLHSVYESVMGGDGASWLFGQRAAHMLDENELPASSLSIITKDMAMVTEHGRCHRVPLPLSSITHQLLVQALSAAWDAKDDCVTINAYLLTSGTLQDLRQGGSQPRASSNLDAAAASSLLIGIHAAVAIEVLLFAKKLGLDLGVLKEVVQGAAGSSVMFGKVCAQVEKIGKCSLVCLDDFDSISQNMANAIASTRALGYPLFIASTALQQYYCA